MVILDKYYRVALAYFYLELGSDFKRAAKRLANMRTLGYADLFSFAKKFPRYRDKGNFGDGKL